MPRIVLSYRFVLATGLCLLAMAGCRSESGPVELGAFPLDRAEDLLEADPHVESAPDSPDGGGSIHIFTDEPVKINLVEIATPDFEGDTVIVRASTRSMTLSGYASLELWLYAGEADARGLRRPFEGLSRTTEWTEREVRFEVPDGIEPDRIRLMLHLGGQGHVWLDDLKVYSARIEDLEGA